jgi:hypothetical protein
MHLIRHAAAAAVLLAATSAAADDLVAISNTAMSITGDISLDDFEIVFENGKRLEFEDLVADTFIVGGEEVAASLYSVKNPSNPKLLNGNRLCGSGPVTYVAVWGTEDTIVAMFDTQDVPESDEAMCASYTYGYE